MPLFFRYHCNCCNVRITIDHMINQCPQCQCEDFLVFDEKVMIEPVRQSEDAQKVEVVEEKKQKTPSEFTQKVMKYVDEMPQDNDFLVRDLALKFDTMSASITPAIQRMVRAGHHQSRGQISRGRPTVYRKI